MGVYRHYKGQLYLVLGLAADSNADEFASFGWIDESEQPIPLFSEGRVVVVYIGLQLDGAEPGPRMHVRTLEDFTAWVLLRADWPPTVCHPADAFEETVARDEGWQPRFRYLDPVLTEQALSGQHR